MGSSVTLPSKQSKQSHANSLPGCSSNRIGSNRGHRFCTVESAPSWMVWKFEDGRLPPRRVNDREKTSAWPGGGDPISAGRAWKAMMHCTEAIDCMRRRISMKSHLSGPFMLNCRAMGPSMRMIEAAFAVHGKCAPFFLTATQEGEGRVNIK